MESVNKMVCKDLHLIDKMQTLTIDIVVNEKEFITESFSCTKAFKQGKFKNSYANRIEKEMIKKYYPAQISDLKALRDIIVVIRRCSANINNSALLLNEAEEIVDALSSLKTIDKSVLAAEAFAESLHELLHSFGSESEKEVKEEA